MAHKVVTIKIRVSDKENMTREDALRFLRHRLDDNCHVLQTWTGGSDHYRGMFMSCWVSEPETDPDGHTIFCTKDPT